jgi:hypothetical protein
MNVDPTHSPLEALIAQASLAELGAGDPKPEHRERLLAIDESSVALGGVVRDRAMARACLAGMWLAYDFLDESHRISQELETREGAYWHGIMHRREGDFSNSKYWFRRVGEHPIHADLHDGALRLAKKLSATARFAGDRWSAERFVDLCQQAIQAGAGEPDGPAMNFCRRVADLEWRLLFDYCRERA